MRVPPASEIGLEGPEFELNISLSVAVLRLLTPNAACRMPQA